MLTLYDFGNSVCCQKVRITLLAAACAIMGFVAAALMPDYTGKDISAEYDA
jgi:hypothetical protein